MTLTDIYYFMLISTVLFVGILLELFRENKNQRSLLRELRKLKLELQTKGVIKGKKV